ncbi:DUF721 domain-containing protein [Gilvibacter sp.]|uniref:DUF721 domain-containing protein n=1 Tax=Gilvibacter sp. TaxID=2729997 RepID=UPI0025C6A7DB|nr:DUF721 domain-containing protein [Gilvibacter sp.]NQX78047.1 DUF721 domain-containing protein [Gilvibacter sp.]
MNKRSREHISLGDALKEFFGQGKLKRGMDQMNVRDTWNKMMGQAIAGYTEDIRLESGTLYVRLTSSVLREELSYGKQKIISMLNEELGTEMIKKLVLR